MKPHYADAVRLRGSFRDSQTVDFTKLSENGIFSNTGQTGAGKTTVLTA